MPDQLQGIVERMVSAGESEENIAAVIQHYKAPAPAQTAPEPGFIDRAVADNPNAPMGVRLAQGALRLMKNHPVGTGAAIGGALAAPFTGGMSAVPAMGLMGLSTAGGAGYGMLAKGAMTGDFGTPEGNAKTLATEAASGAVGEGSGRVLMAAANRVIPGVLKGIIRPTKTVQEEFPDVISTARAQKIPVGQSAEAGRRAGQSAGRADELVALHDRLPNNRIPVDEATQGFGAVEETMAKRARLGMGDETPVLRGRASEIAKQNPDGIGLADAQGLKREAQGVASRTFRAIDRGNVVNDTGALTDKALAQGLRKGIEARVTGQPGSGGIKAINQQTQSLMGLEHALGDAEARNGGIVGLNPINWAGSLAPGAASRLAFGADSMAQAANAPLARLIRQVLLAQLASGDQGETR